MFLKIVQRFPLGIKGLIFQISFGLILSLAVSFFGLSIRAFWAGFIFANGYMLLFFYAVFWLFEKKKKGWGLALLGLKWLLLALALLAVVWLLEGKSFLIGSIGILSFLIGYVLENLSKNKV